MGRSRDGDKAILMAQSKRGRHAVDHLRGCRSLLGPLLFVQMGWMSLPAPRSSGGSQLVEHLWQIAVGNFDDDGPGGAVRMRLSSRGSDDSGLMQGTKLCSFHAKVGQEAPRSSACVMKNTAERGELQPDGSQQPTTTRLVVATRDACCREAIYRGQGSEIAHCTSVPAAPHVHAAWVRGGKSPTAAVRIGFSLFCLPRRGRC